MLSVAPLKTLIETETSVPVSLDSGQIGFAVVVFAWLVWRIRTRYLAPFPRTWLMGAMGLLVAVFFMTALKAASFGAWATEWMKWVEMLVLVLVVTDFARAGRWPWIAFAVGWSAVLQALIGLYEFQGGSGAPHLWINDFRHFRAFGTFGQPNPFSAFMGLVLPLALGMAWGYLARAWQEMRRYRNAPSHYQSWVISLLLSGLWGGGALLILAGLLASWGRGGWLGFGAAALVMVLFAPRNRWIGVGLLAGIAVGSVLLLLIGAVPSTIHQRFASAYTEFTGFGDVRGVPVNDENYATVERLAHWQAALAMANANPLLGVGLGNYEAAYPDYALPRWPQALGHAHNDYLNMLAETGLVGFIAYVLVWGLIIYRTLRALRLSDVVMRGAILGLLGTWTHLAVHSLVDKLYVNNLFLHIGVMLGLLAYLEQRQHHVNLDSGYGDL